jgi:hypothetical protein
VCDRSQNAPHAEWVGPQTVSRPDMARIVLLAAEGNANGGIVVRHGRLRDRMAARWRAGSLDRKLAGGDAPDSQPALALRAQTLIGPSMRTALARQVQRVVREARERRARGRARIPTHEDEVLAAADDLDVLARRLGDAGPVSARGVADVRVLLTDGSGPLYDRGARVKLRTAVTRALEHLEVRIENA